MEKYLTLEGFTWHVSEVSRDGVFPLPQCIQPRLHGVVLKARQLLTKPGIVIMPPTSKKLTVHIGFGLSVRASIRSRTVHARVLKFHIWIPHGKIADSYFFSCPSYFPFWSYAL